jgi:futalosine hydrolase
MLLLAAATDAELDAALRGLGVSGLRPEKGTVPSCGACPAEVRGMPGLLSLATGVGVINAAWSLGAALSTTLRRPPRGVVLAGVAGTYDARRLPLGAVCVAASECWPEYGLGTEDGVDARALKFPLLTEQGGPVWNRMDLKPEQNARAMGLALPGSWPRAAGVTVSTVSGTAERAGTIARAHAGEPLPLMENMEGFAAALACRRLGVPLLEVRTISNLVGSRNPGDWNLRAALEALGEAARALLGPEARHGQTDPHG